MRLAARHAAAVHDAVDRRRILGSHGAQHGPNRAASPLSNQADAAFGLQRAPMAGDWDRGRKDVEEGVGDFMNARLASTATPKSADRSSASDTRDLFSILRPSPACFTLRLWSWRSGSAPGGLHHSAALCTVVRRPLLPFPPLGWFASSWLQAAAVGFALSCRCFPGKLRAARTHTNRHIDRKSVV